MTRIQLDDTDKPGVAGLLAYRPEAAGPLLDLTEVLMRDENTLSRGERELVAALVSERNGCRWTRRIHGSFAAAQLAGGARLVDEVCVDLDHAPIPEKLRALLRLAETVAVGGKAVTDEVVDRARDLGATDREIHDVVLIAATFSMFNRYVTGLAAVVPDDPEVYRRYTERLLATSYPVLGGARTAAE
ncbi:carboxymuconolactone decarboxylase family protein [Saccharothrix stipae]